MIMPSRPTQSSSVPSDLVFAGKSQHVVCKRQSAGRCVVSGRRERGITNDRAAQRARFFSGYRGNVSAGPVCAWDRESRERRPDCRQDPEYVPAGLSICRISLVFESVFDEGAVNDVPLRADGGFFRHLAVFQTRRHRHSDQQSDQQHDSCGSEQAFARIFDSAESLRLEQDGPIKLSSEPEGGNQNGNGDPLQAPRSGFACGYPVPESERIRSALEEGDESLDHERPGPPANH